MSLAVISRDLILSQGVLLSGNEGAIGWQTLATAANTTVTSETAAGPLSNMLNNSTAFYWQASSTATQTITITTGGTQVDYIGIARHNLAQSGLTITVKFDYVTVVPARAVVDQTTMILLSEASPTTVTITIAGAGTAAKIAVLYIGQALKLERNIYVGHTPITYGRDISEINAMSENGQYIGRIVRNETRSTEITLRNLTPAWYRESLDPFIAARVPCFWAWRPLDYAAEVGFCWIEGAARPVNERSNGMMGISWNFKGIA